MSKTNLSWSDSLTEVNRKREFQLKRKVELIWYTDGSKTNKSSSAGVDDRTTYRTLLSEITLRQNGIDRKVPRKRGICHTLHSVHDCESTTYLRCCHLGHYFMDPGDYQDAPVCKIDYWRVEIEQCTLDH
jgi:hypothetical protein